jgi:hypothetical protein
LVECRVSRLQAILSGGFVVGAIDLIDAGVFFGLRSGTTLPRILRSIAAGVLGRQAATGGTAAALLGLVLHFTIALLIVLTYFLLSRVFPVMRTRVLLSGVVFGVAAYFVMQYVVIPLSATARGPFAWPVFLNGIAIHACGVGPAAAWFVSRARR